FSDLVQHAASQVTPQFSGAHMASPDTRFGTHQLGTLFTVTIAGDYYIARRLDNHVTDVHYKCGQNLGMRVADASTSHFRLRNDRGSMLVVESISVDQGGVAEARCRLVHVLDPTIASDALVPT